MDATGQAVTDKLGAALREKISAPGHLSSVIKPTPRAAEGYFEEIRIEATGVSLKRIKVTELSMDARNVRIDVPRLMRDGQVETLSSQTTLRAVITEDDLTDMLATGNTTRDMGLKVKYQGTKVSITGNLNYSLVNGPVTGLGGLRMLPGHKVNLDILSLKLRGVEAPSFLKGYLSSKLNPVLDFQDVPFNPPFKGVTVSGQRAVIAA